MNAYVFIAAVLSSLVCAACVETPKAENRPPVARAGADQRAVVSAGTVHVKLDGSESWDPDGDALSWVWNVVEAPNGMQITRDVRDEAQPVVALTTWGLYIFELKVDDGLGLSSPDYVNVWIEPQTPPWLADAEVPDAADAGGDAGD